MSQSLSQLYVHLTFGTKNRFPFINHNVEQKLHSYIAGTLKNYECPAIIINSVSDHIHILFRLSKNYSLSKIVEEIKKQSSKWMKEIEEGHKKFSWQTGYGAFSVSNSGLLHVKNYIKNQQEHHKKESFKDELRRLFKEHGIDIDERFFP
jgi:REP element-mobilizing transposase RayT